MAAAKKEWKKSSEIRKAFSLAKAITGIAFGTLFVGGLTVVASTAPIWLALTPVACWAVVNSSRRKKMGGLLRDRRDDEYGGIYETSLVAQSILDNRNIKNKKDAAILAGVTRALRQNIVTQPITSSLLGLASVADAIGAVTLGSANLATQVVGSKKIEVFNGKKEVWHNTCLDIFTRAGFTAPYKERIESSQRNSLYAPKPA